MRRPSVSLAGLALLCLGVIPSLHGQGTTISDSVRALNRSGQWAAAGAMTREHLPHITDPAERCRLLTRQAYADLRVTERARQLREPVTVPSPTITLAEATGACVGSDFAAEVAQLASIRQELDSAAAATPAPVGGAPAPAHLPDDDFWKTSDPAAQGMNPAVLAEHLVLCRETGADACLVIRHGVIVQEWYSPLYNDPMMAMSSTKSVAGLLTGMLIADGKIGGVDDRVCRYLQDWCEGRRGQVTLQHLLTMTAGLPMMQDSGVGHRGHKNDFVRTLQPTSTPGTTWAYSNEDVQLIAPILIRAAGEPIEDYAQRRLFTPLGMRNSRLHVQDEAWLYADMETTARDFARLGLLALHHGVWQGKQIVPADWMARSTRPSQSLNARYGLLWWLDAESKSFLTQGYLATDIRVVPDLDLVVVRMQSKPVPGLSTEGTYRTKSAPLVRRMVTDQR